MWNHRNIESRDTWWPTNRGLNCIVYKTNKKYINLHGPKTFAQCSVQPFWRLLDTNQQKNKRPNIYIDCFIFRQYYPSILSEDSATPLSLLQLNSMSSPEKEKKDKMEKMEKDKYTIMQSI